MHEHIEKLMALHDGELSPDEEQEVRELIARDPEAQRCMSMLEGADAAFSEQADALLEQPVPQALIDSVRESPPQSAKILRFPQRRAVVSLAMAAGLAAILITASPSLLQRGGPEVTQGDDPVFTALLQQGLEEAPSGEILSSADGSAQIAPQVTYRTTNAGFCREYMALQGETEMSGTACRGSDGLWEVIDLRRSSTVGGEAYRAAEGAESSRQTSAALDGASTLSYSEEAEALRSGWQMSALEGSQ